MSGQPVGIYDVFEFSMSSAIASSAKDAKVDIIPVILAEDIDFMSCNSASIGETLKDHDPESIKPCTTVHMMVNCQVNSFFLHFCRFYGLVYGWPAEMADYAAAVPQIMNGALLMGSTIHPTPVVGDQKELACPESARTLYEGFRKNWSFRAVCALKQLSTMGAGPDPSRLTWPFAAITADAKALLAAFNFTSSKLGQG